MQQDTCYDRKKATILVIAFSFLFTMLICSVTWAQADVDLDDIWDFNQQVPPVETEETVKDPPVTEEPEPPAPVEVEADNDEDPFDFPEMAPLVTPDPELDEEARELTRGELVRRQEKMVRAEDRLRNANSLLREGKYEDAITQYRDAERMFAEVSRTAPDVVRRLERIDSLITNAYQEWVDELMDEARREARVENWERAMDMVEQAREVDPDRAEELNRLAQQLRDMRQEIEFRSATDASAVDPDAEERRYDTDVLMQQGKVLYENQRYMEARNAFEQILVIDPYSVEAMRRLRMINRRLIEAGDERRLTVREEMAAEGAWTWAHPIKPVDREERPVVGEPVERVRTDARIRDKLQNIIFPSVDFEEATIHQVVRFLQQRSKELDPDNEGVNIVLHLTGEPRRPAEERREPARRDQPAPAWDDWDDWDEPGFDDWDLDVPDTRPDTRRDEPRPAAPQDIGSLTLNMENVPLGEIIRFVCMSAGLRYHIETHAVIISDRELPEGELVTRFFPVKAGIFEGRPDRDRDDDRDPWDMTEPEPTAMDPADVRAYFRNLGVSFPEGATIHYDERISTLIVRNTERNIQEIESILEQINVRRSQVTIEAKFVEIYQRDLEGLGFQWFLNEGHTVYESSGGSRRFDVDSGDLSAGVRRIQDALSTEQASDLLSATAILGNLELDLVLHALEQRGNADILSAPKVTTTSGNTALIRMVQERYFPEDWDESEVTFDDEGQVQSVIPSSPMFGDARDIGVILEVTPTVEGDGYTIGLDLRPEVVEFLGYDTELDTVDPETGIVYRYSMPIIEARTIDTGVIVYNNETVVLGGMIKEEIEDYEDKVPILGDVPLLGRLFRSRGSRSEKRNLLIFVTARLVDPAGQPIREQPLRGVPDFNR